MDISFIIVNYRSEQFLEKCIASIKDNVGTLAYEIIVINNDTRPLSLTQAPNVKVLNQTVNSGFARACNLGSDIANGKYLFFLNPDSQLFTSDLSLLLSEFQDNSVGVCGPQLLTAPDQVQPWSCGYETGLWDILKNNCGFAKSARLWTSKHRSEVDWVSGGALVITKKLFATCAGFDEGFFLYFEDMDLCKRVRALSKKIIMLPQIKVLHQGGASSQSTKLQKKYYYASQDYYFAKHKSIFAALGLKILRKISLLFA